MARPNRKLVEYGGRDRAYQIRGKIPTWVVLRAATGKCRSRRASKNTKWPWKGSERRGVVLTVINPATIETVLAVDEEVHAKNVFAAGRIAGKRLRIIVVQSIGTEARNVRQRIAKRLIGARLLRLSLRSLRLR